MTYTPPSPEDLRRLKAALGLTGEQMAALFGLAGGQQWRKYTGGESPRDMSLHMAFFAAARLALDADAMEAVTQRMRAMGAQVDGLAPFPLSPPGRP